VIGHADPAAFGSRLIMDLSQPRFLGPGGDMANGGDRGRQNNGFSCHLNFSRGGNLLKKILRGLALQGYECANRYILAENLYAAIARGQQSGRCKAAALLLRCS
jgi:hypothetical protein